MTPAQRQYSEAEVITEEQLSDKEARGLGIDGDSVIGVVGG
jgi:hypothetical protein